MLSDGREGRPEQRARLCGCDRHLHPLGRPCLRRRPGSPARRPTRDRRRRLRALQGIKNASADVDAPSHLCRRCAAAGLHAVSQRLSQLEGAGGCRGSPRPGPPRPPANPPPGPPGRCPRSMAYLMRSTAVWAASWSRGYP